MATYLKACARRPHHPSTLPKAIRYSSSSPRPSPPLPTSALIKVESKFRPSAHLKKLLRSGRPIAPAASSLIPGPRNHTPFSFEPQVRKLISDQYFDLDDKLCSQGIWLRYRISSDLADTVLELEGKNIEDATNNTKVGQWEAKVRISGDYQDSAFTEVVGEHAVREMLENRCDLDLRKLKMMAWLNTYRSSWRIVDGRSPWHDIPIASNSGTEDSFVMVIDNTKEDPSGTCNGGLDGAQPFRHEVGEIEMTHLLNVDSLDDENVVTAKDKEAKEMRAKIKAFMMRYFALFPPGEKVDGKLSAYYAWRKKYGTS